MIMIGIGILVGFVILVIAVQHLLFGKDGIKLQGDDGLRKVKVPDGSMGRWPLLGETLAFLKPHKSYTMSPFLEKHCSRYGKVFKSHLFGSPTIVSCDLELNNFILQNDDKLFQSFYPKPVRDVLGDLCMMLVTGDHHKKLRNVALSFVIDAKLNPEYPRYVHDSSVSLMKSWKQRREISFCKEAKEFTINIMLKSLLNTETKEPLGLKILEDLLLFMKGLVSLPIKLPGFPYTEAIKAKARCLLTIRKMIEEREKNGGVGDRKTGFLDEILAQGSLSIDEKANVVVDLLFAGYETTSGLLALLIYFISHSPTVLEQLKEEHLALRRSKNDDEPLSWEDYKKMTYTSKVVSEATRCGNLVKFVHRKALQDVTYKGYLIPAEWQVLTIFTAPHLDPSLHQDPTKFNPSRWDDQEVSKKVSPYGGGARLCPGAELAKVETAFFLHHLVLNYRWKLIREDDVPMSYPYLEFKGGLQIEIESIEPGFLPLNSLSDIGHLD